MPEVRKCLFNLISKETGKNIQGCAARSESSSFYFLVSAYSSKREEDEYKQTNTQARHLKLLLILYFNAYLQREENNLYILDLDKHKVLCARRIPSDNQLDY